MCHASSSSEKIRKFPIFTRIDKNSASDPVFELRDTASAANPKHRTIKHKSNSFSALSKNCRRMVCTGVPLLCSDCSSEEVNEFKRESVRRRPEYCFARAGHGRSCQWTFSGGCYRTR